MMRLEKGSDLLVFLLFMILLNLFKDIQCRYSIDVNSTVTVQEHSCVTIPCTFTAENRNSFTNSRGYWKKDNDIVAATSNSIAKRTKPNFHFTGDTDKGDCTLSITDAKKEDFGTYYFRLEGPYNYNYRTNSITVYVTDPPKKPEVVITSADGGLVDTNSPVLIEEGKALTLNCSAAGEQSATVTWIKGSGQSSAWSSITVTPSEADTYRCLVWDEHWFREKRLQISPQENNVKIFYLLIGILCGIAIVILFIVASKLVARKYFKMNICVFVHTEYAVTEETPAEDKVEDNPEDVYMNVDKLQPVTKVSEDANKPQDSNSIPNGQEEIHYSNIVFSSYPSRTSPMQEETEYAQIVK